MTTSDMKYHRRNLQTQSLSLDVPSESSAISLPFLLAVVTFAALVYLIAQNVSHATVSNMASSKPASMTAFRSEPYNGPAAITPANQRLNYNHGDMPVLPTFNINNVHPLR